MDDILINSDTINVVSSKDAEEERVMHSRSDNMKFTSCNDANEVIDEFFVQGIKGI